MRSIGLRIWAMPSREIRNGSTGVRPRGRLNIYPSVRKTPDGVRLNITWRKANRGTRRLVAKNWSVAKRHVWNRWTSQL